MTSFRRVREEGGRRFFLCLFLSTVAHAAILFGLPVSASPPEPEPDRTEMIYTRIPSRPASVSPGHLVGTFGRTAPPPAPPPPTAPLPEKGRPGPPLRKGFNRRPPSSASGSPRKPNAFPPSLDDRRVVVPLLKSEKISNPRYSAYHDRIRARIKRRAYLYVNDPEFADGEVYLSFVLGADGRLRGLRLDPSKTHANAYLREVGLRSIREAAPFPPFPEGLNYPELSFNVVISFERRD